MKIEIVRTVCDFSDKIAQNWPKSDWIDCAILYLVRKFQTAHMILIFLIIIHRKWKISYPLVFWTTTEEEVWKRNEKAFDSATMALKMRRWGGGVQTPNFEK